MYHTYILVTMPWKTETEIQNFKLPQKKRQVSCVTDLCSKIFFCLKKDGFKYWIQQKENKKNVWSRMNGGVKLNLCTKDNNKFWNDTNITLIVRAEMQYFWKLFTFLCVCYMRLCLCLLLSWVFLNGNKMSPFWMIHEYFGIRESDFYVCLVTFFSQRKCLVFTVIFWDK